MTEAPGAQPPGAGMLAGMRHINYHEVDMTQSVSPVLKGLFVCDDVVTHPVSRKPMVVNLWNVVRVPQGESIPFTLSKLCVFACVRGGRGRVSFRLEIVQAASGNRVGQARFFQYEFANPNTTIYARFMLENVRFPELGVYTVELFSESDFLEDQLIQVVASEG